MKNLESYKAIIIHGSTLSLIELGNYLSSLILCLNIEKKFKKHKNFEKIPLDLGEYHSSRGICQNINSPRSRGICNIHASEVKKPPTGFK